MNNKFLKWKLVDVLIQLVIAIIITIKVFDKTGTHRQGQFYTQIEFYIASVILYQFISLILHIMFNIKNRIIGGRKLFSKLFIINTIIWFLLLISLNKSIGSPVIYLLYFLIPSTVISLMIYFTISITEILTPYKNENTH